MVAAFIRITHFPRVLTIGLILFALSAVDAAAQGQSSRLVGPAMIVHFEYYSSAIGQIRALERTLARALKHAHAGELGEAELHADGNDGYLYMYGSDPERLREVATPILKSSELMNSAEISTRSIASKKIKDAGNQR